MKFTKIQRICMLLAIFNLLILATACGGWTSEANSVVSILIAAIPMLVNIIIAFAGVLPQPVIDAVSKWGAEAVSTLEDIKALIADFANAPPNEQASIVEKIQAALKIVTDHLNSLLPDLHIVNVTVQRLVTLVVTEFSALLGIIPVIQGQVTVKREVQARYHAVLHAKEFKHEFNDLAAELGPDYQLK